MVSIFTGLGAGFERGSASTLGSSGLLGSGSIGRNNEQISLNAATGNLLITQRDEFLVGRGPDSAVGRTYNSLEDVGDGDNNDHWRQSTTRGVHGLTGTLNTAGSTIKRDAGDGSVITYTWNTIDSIAAYYATDGAGAYDKLTYASGIWTWTDGDSQFTEKYEAHGVYGLTGTANTSGSTITRIKADGTSSVYSWDAATSKYIVSAGTAGADNLTYTGGVWTWSNSGNPLTQYYYANGANWRITELSDTASQKLLFSYLGATLDKVTTQDGSYEKYSWASGHITQIVTGYTDLATNTAKTLTRTRYGYDGSNRLTTVTVDLTPSDNTIADGKTYVTTYTYDSSGRISTITETDGTSVTITYDGSNRVATYVQTAAGGVTRTTSFSYDTTARQTTITDALNQKTVLSYDTSGNLTQVISPPNGSGAPQVRKFTYTANGEVASVNNGDGDITVYAYDSNGNRISQRDALGNTVTWAYQNNQLLTETHYLVPDTDGAGVGTAGTPQTTRYVYNTNLTVQYAISAGGTVTAYGYDAYGNRTSAIEYVGARYDVSALSTNQVPTAAALTSWIGTIAQGAARRTETSYDARGNIAATRSYAKLLSNGQFDTASEKTETVYAYDQAGNLLARRTFAGNASEVDVFAYDGLGRTISTSNSNGLRTTITFADASQTTTVTLANGSTQVSVYNLAGDLISYTEAGAAVATAVSTYKYDPLGRVKIATDPLGNRTYYFYDATGRKTAQVDPLGAITEYRYDVLGNLTSTTQYATRLTTTQLGTLVDGSGNPTAVTLASIRPSASTEDRWNFSIYDLSGRLVQAVDGTGATTVYGYDGASQLISTTQYATRMSVTQLATLKAAETNQWVSPENGALWGIDAGMTVTAVGMIDGANAYRFDASATGQARFFNAYLPVASTGQTVTFVITLMASGTTTGGVLDLWGTQTAWGNASDATATILSGPGTVTPGLGASTTVSGLSTTVATRIAITHTFTTADNQVLPIFWIKATTASAGDAIIASAPVVTTRFHAPSFVPAADATNDRVTRMFYDTDGNVSGALDTEGYLTQSIYDAGGSKIQTVAYASAVASSLRAAGTFAQLLASAGSATATTTTYKYDAIGRLKLVSDGLGNRTYYFYDPAGRKVADVDSLGALTEYRYDGEGSLTSTTRYATRLTATQLGTLVDGSGNPTAATLASIRPSANADDRWTFSIYDGSERLVQTIDEMGATTVYGYDGASQLISKTQYANRISAASIAALKAAETNQWLNPDNAALWTTSGLTVAAAGTIDGASAFRLTQTTTGTAGYFSQYATKFGDGQLVTFSITVKAVSSSSGIVTLYGPSSGWGSVNDGSISIVSGPGTISNLYSGNGWTISGLSTTAETRIQVTRVYNAPDNQIQAAMWVGSGFSATAGDAIIVAAPVLTSRMRTPVYIPTADAANDRVTRLFYDADGNVTGTLDAEGYLTQSVYDASGAKTQTIAYANATASALRASGTFAQLLASFSPDNAKDVRQWMLYDARGFLAASIDGEGSLTRYTYTVQGMVATRTRGQQLNPATLIATPPTLTTLPAAPAGTVLDVVSYTYDVSGRVRTQTQTLTTSPAVSTTTLYAYDRMGRLVTTTTQSGTSDPHVFSQRYDALGRLTSALNAEGNALLAANPSQIETIYANFGTTYTYDADSRLIAQTEGRGAGLSGARSLYYYNVDDTLAYVVDPSGAVTEYRYTAFGDRGDTILYAKRIVAGTLAGMTGGAATSVASTVAALANAALDSVHHADFNADGTIKSSTGPLGAVTTYAYNAFGELVTEIDPLDAATSSTIQTTRTYDRRGLLKTAVVDSASGGKAITSTYGYDAFGRAVTLTDPASQTSTKTYDRAGRLATATNALSQTTTYSYDGRGNLAAVRSPAITGYSDVVTRYAYDNAGRLVYTVDALGGVTQNSYDDEGRVVLTQSYATAISLAGLATVASASDIAARVTAVSGKDQLTRSVYDRDGQLRYSVDANNFLTEYVYDANGNAIRSTAYSTAIASAPTYTMAAIAAQISAMSAPALAAARTTRNVYTASGQRSFTIDALGYVTAYTYDVQGNVVKQQRVATPYAPTGNPTDSDMVTWLGTNGNTANDRISRAIYDQNGQLRFDVDAEGYVTQYTYDAAGNVRTKIRYSTSYAITDATTLATALTSVGATPPATAAVTEFKYDSAGRLIETIDPEGTRTVMTLNQLGQALTTSVAYGTSDESVTTNSYDALGRMLTETRGYGQPEATTRVFTYDALGNMLTERDGVGNTVTRTYDPLGHVLTETVPLDASTNAVTVNTYDAFGNLAKVVDPRQNAGYFYYDTLNRLVLQVDPEGYATATSYTFTGQIASVTRYAARTTGTPTLTTPPTVVVNAALDAVSTFTYDKLDRVTGTAQVTDSNSAHNITESYGYNAFGDRTSVTNKLGGTTTNVFDKRGLLLSETLPVTTKTAGGAVIGVVNTYAYDARGNLLQMVEASGAAEQRTTGYAYDRLDRLVRTTHDRVNVVGQNLLDQPSVVPTEHNVYNRRGDLIARTDAAGAITLSYYDDVGNKIAEIGPSGTYSAWTYDKNGNVLTAKVYGDAIATLPLDPNSSTAMVYRFYDLILGRMPNAAEVANWVYRMAAMYAGYVQPAAEGWPSVDPNGEPMNQLEGIFTEILGEPGYVARMGAADNATFIGQLYQCAFGRAPSPTETSAWLAKMATGWTRPGMLAYFSEHPDHRAITAPLIVANVAAGTRPAPIDINNARTTTYTYDKNNRLKTTTGNAVKTGYFDGSNFVFSTTAPVATNEYDAAGNLIKATDANGGVTWSYYDKLGRKTAQVDQAGYLTTWTFNADGNVSSERRYATVANGMTTAARPVVATSANDRITLFTYDNAGRRLSERRMAVTGYTTAGPSNLSAVAGTAFDWTSMDVDSQAAQVYRLYDLVLGRPPVASEVTNWVWRMNNMSGGVDPLLWIAGDIGTGGVSGRLDATDNAAFVTQLYQAAFHRAATSTEIATWTNSMASGTTRASMVAYFTDHPDHRAFTDDKIVAKGVTFSDSTDSSVIVYTYDALGSIKTKTEAIGDVTTYFYDAIGRQTREVGPGFKDYAGNDVASVVDRTYDGLNNLTGTVQNSARTTSYVYGAGGRLASMTDANSFTHNYAYDVLGRTLRDSYSRLQADGTSITEAIAYTYDAAGRTVSQTNARFNGSTWTFTDAAGIAYDKNWVRYNAYGDMTGRGITSATVGTAVYQETFSYDANGHLWSSNSGDGVRKFFVYDKAGNQTLTLTSSGADLSALTAANYTNSILASGDTSTANAITTINVYDKRNQLIATRMPDRYLAAGGSSTLITTARTYNAFGEVTTEVDSRGTTTYAYNTMGRNVLIARPATVMYGTGTTAVSPVENFYYDISGRLVASRDANEHFTTQTLLAGTGFGGEQALVLQECHSDGGVITNGYDVFGDLRKVTEAVTTRVTTMEYDKLGRLVKATRPGGLLIDQYSYDGLGQRIKHWNNVLLDAEKTTYDAQGRVTGQVAFGGDPTTITYVWNGGLGTAGLGTFGGWVQTTVYANTTKSSVEISDMFGHVVSRTDMGGHTTAYSFDLGGRLTESAGGQTQRYSYLNTGLAASVSTGIGTGGSFFETAHADYTYDAAGNKLTEYASIGGSASQHAIATYDALGRMKTWVESGSGLNAPPADIAWEYDAVGNIIHMKAHYYLLDGVGAAAGSMQPQEYWYSYDSMNRLVINKGSLSGSTIVRGTNGTLITYNANGERATVTSTGGATAYNIWDPNAWNPYENFGNGGYGNWVNRWYAAEQLETYTYNDTGTLKKVQIAIGGYTDNYDGTVTALPAYGPGDDRATYEYDSLGRLTRQHDLLADGSVAYDHQLFYNQKGQVYREITFSKQKVPTLYDAVLYDSFSSDTSYYFSEGTINYALGSVTSSTTTNSKNNASLPTTHTDMTYVWFDGAAQNSVVYTPDMSVPWTTQSTQYSYNGAGVLTGAVVSDGRPRTITVTSDAMGQVTRRVEADTLPGGDPAEVWYRFNGKQIGYTGNNGTFNGNYDTSVQDRTATQDPTSAFRFSSTSAYGDFGQNYDAINSFGQGSQGGSYTIRAGDTLQGIAASLWGDASLWYKLAQANGLSASSALVAGQTLSVPAGVVRTHNSTSTFRPYKPSDAYGDTSPTTPAPRAAPKKGCGVFGAILLAVIAVAVAYFVGPEAIEFFQGALGSSVIGGVVGGAVTGALASVVSQGVGVVTGIQDKFSWKGVAMAALSGAVGGGVSQIKGLDGIMELADGTTKATSGVSSVTSAIGRAVIGNVATQGIAVATRLQKSFDWTGVAAAAISGAVSQVAGRALHVDGSRSAGNILRGGVAGAAGGIAGAATRSIVEGTSFGDNVIAALPDVIGQTIGNLLAAGIASIGKRNSPSQNPADKRFNGKTDDEITEIVKNDFVEGAERRGGAAAGAVARRMVNSDPAIIEVLQTQSSGISQARRDGVSIDDPKGLISMGSGSPSAPGSSDQSSPATPLDGQREIVSEGRARTFGDKAANALTTVQDAIDTYYTPTERAVVQYGFAFLKGGPLGVVGSYALGQVVSAGLSATGTDRRIAEAAVAVGKKGLSILSSSTSEQEDLSAQSNQGREAGLLVEAGATLLGVAALGKMAKTFFEQRIANIPHSEIGGTSGASGPSIPPQPAAETGVLPPIVERGRFSQIQPRNANEAQFLANAEATFGKSSTWSSVTRHRDELVIQRSDIELSPQNMTRMKNGQAPFVRNANGDWEPLQLHHVGRETGKMIEVTRSQNRYNPSTGGPLHIPGPGGPVRQPGYSNSYWQQRYENFIEAGRASK